MRVAADDARRAQGAIRRAPLAKLSQLRHWHAVLGGGQGSGRRRKDHEPVGHLVCGEPLGRLAVVVLVQAEVEVQGDVVQAQGHRHAAAHGHVHLQHATRVHHSSGRLKAEVAQVCKGAQGQHNRVACGDRADLSQHITVGLAGGPGHYSP